MNHGVAVERHAGLRRARHRPLVGDRVIEDRDSIDRILEAAREQELVAVLAPVLDDIPRRQERVVVVVRRRGGRQNVLAHQVPRDVHDRREVPRGRVEQHVLDREVQGHVRGPITPPEREHRGLAELQRERGVLDPPWPRQQCADVGARGLGALGHRGPHRCDHAEHARQRACARGVAEHRERVGEARRRELDDEVEPELDYRCHLTPSGATSVDTTWATFMFGFIFAPFMNAPDPIGPDPLATRRARPAGT